MTQVKLAMIGAGGMARHHISFILKQQDTTRIVAVCEPDKAAYDQAAAMFTQAGLKPPVRVRDFDAFMAKHARKVDAAFVVTPHNQHFPQATALLEAGVDVLLEKPMVLNTTQARRLIKTRDKSGRLLVVAFNGSLSPAIRRAAEMIRNAELGKLISIDAAVWQDWERATLGTWRQEPKIAGGGFLFDTGAHMLNTVADLAGQPFADVAAFVDHRGRKVDILGVAIGRLAGGGFVTLHGSGACGVISSEVRVFCERGVIETGVWGERLRVHRAGDPAPVDVALPASLGVWQTFLAVRDGRMPNPSPAEIGMRMIQLWDAMKASAKQGGAPVRVAA